MIVTEKETEGFLQALGFPVIQRVYCESITQCERAAMKLGYPVAMKISSPSILHKSDVGGVALDLVNPAMIKQQFTRMKHIKGFQGVMMQEFITGEFLLLGLKKDPTFGHTVAVGSGGIYTEILHDVSFRVCPINVHDAEEMLEELKIYPMLQGARGGKDVRKEVVHLLVRLSEMAQNYPMITELDINPLILHQDRVVVADARMVVDDALPRS
ncbi:MAG: acetate--CoA ligase family protein [Nanoarchaeota archaeon]